MKSIIFQGGVAHINSITQESEAEELLESEVSLSYKMSTVPARAKCHPYIDNSPPKKNNMCLFHLPLNSCSKDIQQAASECSFL